MVYEVGGAQQITFGSAFQVPARACTTIVLGRLGLNIVLE